MEINRESSFAPVRPGPEVAPPELIELDNAPLPPDLADVRAPALRDSPGASLMSMVLNPWRRTSTMTMCAMANNHGWIVFSQHRARPGSAHDRFGGRVLRALAVSQRAVEVELYARDGLLVVPVACG
jgi:hypothetical protein